MSSAFDPRSIRFSALEKNKMGGKVVYCSPPDNPKARIAVQFPALNIPFGAEPYVDATGETQSYSMNVSFRGDDTDPKIADLLAKMRVLDDVLLDTAVERSKEWFGKVMSRELVSEFFRRLVKDPKDPKYAPVMKMKIPLSGGEPTTQFYDETRAPCTVDNMSKGATVRCIAELSSVWFVNKTFGVTWRLVQCAVASRPRRLEGYSFQDDEDMAETTAEPVDDAAVVDLPVPVPVPVEM